MTTFERLRAEIPAIVTSRWQQSGSPVFLSYLGGLLSAEAKFELRAAGISLKEFIRQYLSTSIRLFVIGETGDALAPEAETVGQSDEQLAARYISVPRMYPFQRFLPAVWRAFSRPLLNEKRYLDLSAGRPAILHDVSATENPASNWIEVLQGDIPPADPPRGIPAPINVVNAITAWAEKHNVEVRTLHDISQSLSVRSALSKSSDVSRASGADRLRGFLEILDSEDLVKINIPSDVLLRILRRSD
jgi:hypothetical protein